MLTKRGLEVVFQNAKFDDTFVCIKGLTAKILRDNIVFFQSLAKNTIIFQQSSQNSLHPLKFLIFVYSN